MLPHLPQNDVPQDASAPLDLVKIEQDIAFLTERIARMRRLPNPNLQLITHYEAMLRGRSAVLSWLQDGDNDLELPRHQA